MWLWLRYLWSNEDGFFGIGMGPSGAEKNDAGLLGNIGTFATGTGEADILKAQNFWSSILSGDMSKISQVLGPEFSAINKQGQQQKKTMAEFGNRGGGTNAIAGSIDTGVTTQINDMIAKLTSGSASSLGNMGQGLLGTGLGADEAKFSADKTIHDQQSAKINDIIKSGVAVAAAPFTGGASLGMLAGGSSLGKLSMPSFPSRSGGDFFADPNNLYGNVATG